MSDNDHSFTYVMELSWRTIHILCVDRGELRERLPRAWDEGMSMISPESLPVDCERAKNGLVQIRETLNADLDSYMARTFGAARASVRRKHGDTLERVAELVLDVRSDLERHEEYRKQHT